MAAGEGVTLRGRGAWVAGFVGVTARRIVLPFCGLTVLLALSLYPIACGRSEDPAYARGSTLTMAVHDVRVLLPDTDVDFLVFVSLTDRDERGEVVPRLARSWEHSADYREWTYHLRTDVCWHDGAPVTAHDVKFTLDLPGRCAMGELWVEDQSGS